MASLLLIVLTVLALILFLALAFAHRRIGELEGLLDEQQSSNTEEKFHIVENTLTLLSLKEKLEEEQAKTKRLLRNILPEKVIEQLEKNGYAKPEMFENVTVFFSDIVNFTTIASQMSPEDLIGELSDIFSHFDAIFTRNRCERIKTVGDAYLSVSGLPTPDPDHCENIIHAAIEAMEYIEGRNKFSRYKWQMRMGVHSGRVVAGIVGTNKYLYDVFGDTVNTSARMEQHGEEMKINVSEATMNLARNKFDFLERDPVDVKGKGTMKMYFLERPK